MRFPRYPAHWVGGLAVRLLLMPAAACWDLWHSYGGAHDLVYHHHLPREIAGGALIMLPSTYLHAAWLAVLHHVFRMPHVWSDHWQPISADPTTWIDVQGWTAFLQSPGLHAMLIGMKVPYLVCEVLMIRLMLPLVTDPRHQQRLSAFLWFNPFSLYLVTLFGSWDIVVVLIVAGALAAAHRQRPFFAALLLGLAIPWKLFPVFFVPFVLIFGPASIPARLGMAACLGGPAVLWLMVATLLHVPLLHLLLQAHHVSYPLSLTWPLIHDARLYPFVIVYVALILSAASSTQRSPRLMEGLATYGLCSLLLFYSFSFFHVQYFLWCIPFCGLCGLRLPRWGLLTTIQAVGFFLYTFQWNEALTTRFFAPLAPSWFLALPDPSLFINRWVPMVALASVGHSLLAGASLWMVWRLLAPQPKP